MRLALFSDIHSNLDALEAVLKDIESSNIDRMACLGDVVGYAANPVECLALVRELDCPVILGNHDQEASRVNSLERYKPVARSGMEYSRSKLSEEDKHYLSNLPYKGEIEGVAITHASFFRPQNWAYVYDLLDVEISLLAQECRVGFYGHTHVPCFFEKDGRVCRELPYGEVLRMQAGRRYLVNIGSVGQPRDMDSRACYVIYDSDQGTIEHRRVEYDIDKAMRRILDADLPPFLAQRLSLGR